MVDVHIHGPLVAVGRRADEPDTRGGSDDREPPGADGGAPGSTESARLGAVVALGVLVVVAYLVRHLGRGGAQGVELSISGRGGADTDAESP